MVLKGYNHDGVRIDGSVGKGLGYGAIRGMIIVQGNADSRACVRLSGADVVIGGEILEPPTGRPQPARGKGQCQGLPLRVHDRRSRARAGRPGPWICAGMTGGILYLRLQPSLGF